LFGQCSCKVGLRLQAKHWFLYLCCNKLQSKGTSAAPNWKAESHLTH
jgi:hypothetical protein